MSKVLNQETFLEINYKKYFEGKRITKQGFGFLGRGANVVKFLLENGANVLVTDMKSEKDLEKSIREVEDFIQEKKIDKSKITYRLGEHKLEDFETKNCDFVIQASGVAKDNIYLNHSKENNIKVYQESSLFVEIIRDFNSVLEEEDKIKIIGATGTRGKTTTTFLIKKIIEDYLENTNRKVYFGGNVQGVATLESLKSIKEGDVMVMELDSWILQGFADIKYSPNISVFTNIMPDHMNYYKGDMQDYFHDKAAIFLNQKSKKDDTDVFVSTENVMMNMEKYLSEEELKDFYNNESKKVFLNEENILDINNNFKSNLLGAHNKINVALAVTACKSFGVDNINIQKSLANFFGVAGRLEKIRSLNGVDYINDTCATTGDAGIAALESFVAENNNTNKKVILITGGRDKELDMTNYAKKIIDYKNETKNKSSIKNIILLSDDTTTGTKKLLEVFKENNFNDYLEKDSLEKAVAEAARSAASGDIVLFTPAFASFGMFQNEYDRGDRFNHAVNALI